MAKRLRRPLRAVEPTLLNQLAQNLDLWRTVLNLLPPHDLYALKIVSQALQLAVQSYIASLGPLRLLVWRRTKPCGHRSYTHCCGGPFSPCLENVPVQRVQVGQFAIHVSMDIRVLKTCRFLHKPMRDCELSLADPLCANWGRGSTGEHEHFWLDEAGTLRFLDYLIDEDSAMCTSRAMPRATLCWERNLPHGVAAEVALMREHHSLADDRFKHLLFS